MITTQILYNPHSTWIDLWCQAASCYIPANAIDAQGPEPLKNVARPGLVNQSVHGGEVAEWFNARAWKM